MTSGQANFYFIVGLLQHKSTVIMNWIALIIAGILEIGWPLGLKMSQQQGNNKTLWILVALFSMAISGGLLWYSQKSIYNQRYCLFVNQSLAKMFESY